MCVNVFSLRSLGRHFLTAFLLICTLSFLSSSAWAANIPVGDFSFEDASANGFDPNPNDPTAGQSAWDYGGSAGIVGQQFAYAADTLASDGSQLAYLQGAINIAQNIVDSALLPLNGQTLFLSFDAAGRVGNATDGVVTLDIYDVGGGNQQTLGSIPIPIGEVSSNPALNGLRVLSRYEFPFTMPNFGNQFRIQLTHSTPGGGDVSTLIDRVMLTTESTMVPEPSSLIITTVGALLFMSRRKMRSH